MNRYSYALNDPINFFDPDGRTPLLVLIMPGLVGAGVGALAGAIGSTIGQVYANRGFNNFSFKSVGIAAGVGAISGALTAYTGPAGTILVGALAGGGQYLLSQKANGQPVDSFELGVAVTIGGLTGGLSVLFAPAKGMQFGSNRAGLSAAWAARLNAQSQVDAMKSASTLARSAGVSAFSNSVPNSGNRPGGGLGSSGFIQPPTMPGRDPYYWSSLYFNLVGNTLYAGSLATVNVNGGTVDQISPITSPVYVVFPNNIVTTKGV